METGRREQKEKRRGSEKIIEGQCRFRVKKEKKGCELAERIGGPNFLG